MQDYINVPIGIFFRFVRISAGAIVSIFLLVRTLNFCVPCYDLA
ncbi:MAG: hypothetical protein A4E35_00077 [Methanoregula sp. PtaU1.Bin051]|nr:MAG: hypothetical protein A4E35_00077 [Methanoregula sp. PtaU1.Bin051]